MAFDFEADMVKAKQLELDCIHARMAKFGISYEQAKQEYDEFIQAYALAILPHVWRKAIQLLKQRTAQNSPVRVNRLPVR